VFTDRGGDEILNHDLGLSAVEAHLAIDSPRDPRSQQDHRFVTSGHGELALRLAHVSARRVPISVGPRRDKGVEADHAIPAHEWPPEYEPGQAFVETNIPPLANVVRAAFGAMESHRSTRARNELTAAERNVKVNY
jgi:hypothetical protein